LDAVINGSVAAMPAALRGQAEARLDTRTRARLSSLMTTWSGGGKMDRAEFAGQFFGRAAADPVAMGLRTAALTARLSGSQDALRDAAEHLAGAMQAIGLDRLPRFLDDAEVRANEPSALAALEKSRQTLVQRDAIRPVYPVEAAIGIAAAGVAGGAAAVARAVGGAVVRQLLKKSPAIPTEVIRPEGKAAAPNRAEFQKYTDGLRRAMGRPATTDPNLSKIMDAANKQNTKVGSGSTADALRSERLDQQRVGGKWHEQKSKDLVIRLRKWLRSNQMASPGDRAAAENVLRDLQNALDGK
jgi:hypothetical protein